MTTTWKQALRDGSLPGALAGAFSMAALAVRGHRENGSALAPLNAPSHWLWGDEALRQDGPSVRYTAAGLVIHHASAWMWGVLYQRFFAIRQRQAPWTRHVRQAAVATTAAAVVDLALTPQRFTPGFERRLSTPGLVLVYAAFAIGVAAGSRWLAQQGPRTQEENVAS
jgi:hypothetical protein